ncbi:unnamed protein product [Protopolystoma xenopodis]|uniref:Uncharacterized protein n=1 Tax=Protopolystoma xenopodis TaxID=117903 RepID=A0A448XB67_9PLAT|nr:unnamed protein product [Protopolystoma xenopodis]
MFLKSFNEASTEAFLHLNHLIAEPILQQYLIGAIRLAGRYDTIFPTGVSGRSALLYKIIETLYVLGLRTGFEMTRTQMTSAFQLFFANFDRAAALHLASSYPSPNLSPQRTPSSSSTFVSSSPKDHDLAISTPSNNHFKPPNSISAFGDKSQNHEYNTYLKSINTPHWCLIPPTVLGVLIQGCGLIRNPLSSDPISLLLLHKILPLSACFSAFTSTLPAYLCYFQDVVLHCLKPLIAPSSSVTTTSTSISSGYFIIQLDRQTSQVTVSTTSVSLDPSTSQMVIQSPIVQPKDLHAYKPTDWLVENVEPIGSGNLQSGALLPEFTSTSCSSLSQDVSNTLSEQLSVSTKSGIPCSYLSVNASSAGTTHALFPLNSGDYSTSDKPSIYAITSPSTNESIKLSQNLTETEVSNRRAICEELRLTFNAKMAYLAYIPFCRLAACFYPKRGRRSRGLRQPKRRIKAKRLQYNGIHPSSSGGIHVDRNLYNSELIHNLVDSYEGTLMQSASQAADSQVLCRVLPSHIGGAWTHYFQREFQLDASQRRWKTAKFQQAKLLSLVGQLRLFMIT